jgi:hypothetical protein
MFHVKLGENAADIASPTAVRSSMVQRSAINQDCKCCLFATNDTSWIGSAAQLRINADDLDLVGCELWGAGQCPLRPCCQLKRRVLDIKSPHVIVVVIRL